MKSCSVATGFVLVVTWASLAFGQGQDATALEEQYKTCAKHYIPAEKCTPEIYKQLKDKDNAPLDPNTASALKAVKEYQKKLKNPESMQVRTAYVTEKGSICLEIGAQNSLGGQTVGRAVYTNAGKWKDSWDLDNSCLQRGFHRKPVPGTDVTDKVNQALKDGR